MSDTALKARGIEDAETGRVLVGAIAYTGRVRLQVLAGVQDLGIEELDHVIAMLTTARATAFPAAAVGEAA